MQIPFSWGPDTFHSGDSPEHFREGIGHLLKLTNQLSATFKSFTPVQKTRAGLAAYDGGVAAIRQKGEHFLKISYSDNVHICLRTA